MVLSSQYKFVQRLMHIHEGPLQRNLLFFELTTPSMRTMPLPMSPVKSSALSLVGDKVRGGGVSAMHQGRGATIMAMCFLKV